MTTANWILHIDFDQFIAAVEVARHPELRGRPVVVGGSGDPTERAVVATATYEAREYGVHSGMPLRTAAKRCPEAIFLPSDPPAYEEVSAHAMAALRELPVIVEVVGWDEAFLGAATDTPENLAEQARQTVAAATGLSSSVGIGDNKLRAKLATGFAKPAGVFRLTRDNWWEVMAELPTESLWGIGGKTAKKLAALGLSTVYQLSEAEQTMLDERFGRTMGPWYRLLALGIGDTEVVATPYLARSRGREVTFQENLTDRAELDRQVSVLAHRVADDVRTEGRPAVRVEVKVRFAPFITQTRSHTLPTPTDDSAVLELAALAELDRFEHGRPVRLLGVRAELAHGDED
ncbi:DNA polymerase-4 [Tamaricihabitans halophyticus]|uniref:DNA polymerase IV n=1 Tax=Tamaricihabitans halophyticus TaxID=1262583 RepID=A0A4R2QUK1_9PSEU|nr:DNA polymerase IV [Tamaricihabitans halophyticus]TCP50771.1 DNA polymerase-4 [Tamaricihabitans halophyticus]